MLILLLVLPICIWVAYSDMKYMRIPNYAVLALVGVFLVAAPFAMPLDAYFMRILAGIVVLGIGFVMNLLRLLGAGDAKFAAAMAPFFALGDLPIVFILLAAMILVTFAGHRVARAVPAVRGLAPDWASWSSAKFPMGLALASTLAAYLGLMVLAMRAAG